MLRAGVDRSSRSALGWSVPGGQAVARRARTICGSSRQGRFRRSPSTKKVGVAWTPALRPPSMSVPELPVQAGQLGELRGEVRSRMERRHGEVAPDEAEAVEAVQE